MIDVLALPVEEAGKLLAEHGYKVKICRSEPHYRRHSCEDGTPSEYVVRQLLLDNNTMLLTTVIRYRKEVL